MGHTGLMVALAAIAAGATASDAPPMCSEGDSGSVSLSVFTPLTGVQAGEAIQLTLPVFGGRVFVKLTCNAERERWHSATLPSASSENVAGLSETKEFTGHAVGIGGSSVWLTLHHSQRDEITVVIGSVRFSAQSTTLSLQRTGTSLSVNVTCHTVVTDDKALRFHSNDDGSGSDRYQEHTDEPKRALHPPTHPHVRACRCKVRTHWETHRSRPLRPSQGCVSTMILFTAPKATPSSCTSASCRPKLTSTWRITLCLSKEPCEQRFAPEHKHCVLYCANHNPTRQQQPRS